MNKIMSRGAESLPTGQAGALGGKIGIFDSGLGGLVIAKAIFETLPKYDYIYLGDTNHLPYGNRPAHEVYKFTRNAVKYLFEQDCKLVILACNTASALALRKIQQEFLPKYYPDRRVLGVIIPTLETVSKVTFDTVGVIGTRATISSRIYKTELEKINPKIKIYEHATSKLVPMIEENNLADAGSVLKNYLKPLLQHRISGLVLGCTHYPIIKQQISQYLGKNVKIICQTDIIPFKLADYLKRHPEIDRGLNKSSRRQFLVTKSSKHFNTVAKRLFGREIKFMVVKY